MSAQIQDPDIGGGDPGEGPRGDAGAGSRSPGAHAPLASTPADRQFAMLIHLMGLLGYVLGPLAIAIPVAMWLARRDESPFIDDHGREAVNFNISIWIYGLIAAALILAGIGCVLAPAVVIFQIIATIIASTQASSGRWYRYPMTIRMIGS